MAKILLIASAVRKDYLDQFATTAQNHKVVCLHDNVAGTPQWRNYKNITIKRWSGFLNMQGVFNTVKPDYVVSLHINNYVEVLALLISREQNIPFYQIDHGLSQYSKKILGKTRANRPRVKKNSIFRKIRFRLFSHFSRQSLSSSKKSRFDLFKTIRKNIPSPRQIYIKLGADAKHFLPDKYIAYSKHNYQVFLHNYGLTGEQSIPCSYIGLPGYDAFANSILPNVELGAKNALIVDQPLYMLGYPLEEQEQFYRGCIKSLLENGYKVYIKPHPITAESLNKKLDDVNVTFIDNNDDLAKISASISVCIGFNSTLLLPFAANERCVLFCNTSIKQIQKMTREFYTSHKVAHAVENVGQLDLYLTERPKLLKEQESHILAFTEYAMYKFDGKSGERLSKLFDN